MKKNKNMFKPKAFFKTNFNKKMFKTLDSRIHLKINFKILTMTKYLKK